MDSLPTMHALKAKNARREFLRGHRGRVGGVRAARPNGTRAKRLPLRSGATGLLDPLIGNPANSQSLNPYSYIGNNPLSGIDPTGYQCVGSHIESQTCEDTGASVTQIATPSVTEKMQNFVRWVSASLNGTATMSSQSSGAVSSNSSGAGGNKDQLAGVPSGNTPQTRPGEPTPTLPTISVTVPRSVAVAGVAFT